MYCFIPSLHEELQVLSKRIFRLSYLIVQKKSDTERRENPKTKKVVCKKGVVVYNDTQFMGIINRQKEQEFYEKIINHTDIVLGSLRTSGN